jgi:nucleotide-binding universal stress UspA family protein
MKNVLLMIPPNSESKSAVQEAIAAAKQRGGRLLVVVALDPDVLDGVCATLSNVGFMGEKVSDQVQETLLREYRTRAEEMAHEIARQAEAAGVSADSKFEEGDPSEICRRLIPSHEITLAVLVAEKRSWLARLLARNSLQVPTLAGCEVRVIEEDA